MQQLPLAARTVRFVAAARAADSFDEALRSALSTLCERLDVSSAVLLERMDEGYRARIAIGAFAFEAVSIGMWLAMGAGAFVMRLPFVFASICIVCTAIGLAATSMEPVERIDFIAILLSAGLIVFLAFTLFLIVRRFVRRRPGAGPDQGKRGACGTEAAGSYGADERGRRDARDD